MLETENNHSNVTIYLISNLVLFSRDQASDSDQSLNLSDVNVSLPYDKTDTRRLSRSDSWTFYDTATSGRIEGIEELDKISSAEEDALEREVPPMDRTSSGSNESQASVQNSLYENLSSGKTLEENHRTPSITDSRHYNSLSLIFEFDPFAKNSDNENVYSNFENNDMMLLEALLATSDSPSSSGSILDFQEAVDNEEDQSELDNKDILHPQISSAPPVPPKRFDSLPKNEHEEAVENSSVSDKGTVCKNPTLLPKLAHLITKKQPAVPPRKPARNLSVDSLGTTGNPVSVNDETSTGKYILFLGLADVFFRRTIIWLDQN